MKGSPDTGARRVRQAAFVLGGLALGVATVPIDLVTVLGSAVSARSARAAITVERRRLALFGVQLRGTPDGHRAVGYLVTRALLGMLTGLIGLLLGAGIVIAVSLVIGAATGAAVPIFDANEPGQVTWMTVAVLVLPGVALFYLAVQGLAGMVGTETRVWNAFARPSSGALAQRVDQLTATRADIIDAIDEERRRIERDLHDGVQQRVIALSILLARGERESDRQRQADLRRRALAETRHILADLREVSWKIYPAMLARDGLRSALEALADRTPLPTVLDYRLARRPPRPVESACYFTASEAITNAIKHAGARRIDLTVAGADSLLIMTVRDDGCGGADPAGLGLAGIASRITALDGVVAIDSPPGGPTTIRVEVPCA
ncbi:signal transduction histidine kinase [Nocardia tenerifensis]|uniref:histidine kinase n=1 Tax=Nocardia tenerifensis TaxID=228006 RepID=A0A318KAX1_9NOCA|nr:ATP-binding protein [Nocardia tenerifensis]PXX71017.1 signal transduction histidine kinase [Nocardia tenerifensis]